jgi:hypothetical protein
MHYAEIARPLYDLTRKDQLFIWGESQERAFVKLKVCLTSAPLLAAPLDVGQFTLDTDASGHAVSAILQQEQDGVLKVICYASRVLQPSEINYCSTKIELLAVIFGLKQYRHFLLCRDFLIRTDNAALTYLLRTPEPLAQQSRWLNLISEYSFKIIHRAGILNGACDALSRKPCEREDPTKMCSQCRPKSVRQAVAADACRAVRGQREECSLAGGDHGSTAASVGAAPVPPPAIEHRAIQPVDQLFDTKGELSLELLRTEQQRDPVIRRVIDLISLPDAVATWADLNEDDAETRVFCTAANFRIT